MVTQSRKWVWILVCVLWMGMIFYHSLQIAEVSSQASTGLLLKLRHFFPWLTEPVLRKLAHFAEFGMFGLLISNASISFSGQLLWGLCTALTDETIQLFVPGRSGEIRDVWIDFSGVFLACSVVLLLFSIFRRRKRRA